MLFKREFSFAGILRLWEILWTELPCKNFHLRFCVALLDRQTDIIIESGSVHSSIFFGFLSCDLLLAQPVFWYREIS